MYNNVVICSLVSGRPLALLADFTIHNLQCKLKVIFLPDMTKMILSGLHQQVLRFWEHHMMLYIQKAFPLSPLKHLCLLHLSLVTCNVLTTEVNKCIKTLLELNTL